MQLEKVRRFILKNHLLGKGETVIAAVSGGPDSLCLLHMLHTLSAELEIKLIVAHLNHCLRPEAELEVSGVLKIASAWSLPFETKAVDIRGYKEELSISEEEAGRRARYDFLYDMARKHKASSIVLGHHLDDQAETVLLNIIRGTGVDGLAGILAKRFSGRVKLLRPLLCLRRSEIEAYCNEQGLQPFTDSSNLETFYTRNKLRLELIPHLENNFNPRIREALISLAELAGADRQYLNLLARKSMSAIACIGRNSIQFDRQRFMFLPPALRGRVLRLALQRYGRTKNFSRLHINQLLSLAENAVTGKQVILPGNIRAYSSYGRLVIDHVSDLKQEKFEPLKLEIPGKVTLPGNTVITARLAALAEINRPLPSYRACLDYKKLPPGSLTVRLRRPGDRFHPQGAPGSKKLKEFLIDRKVPADRRNLLPLVEIGGNIIWVAGIRIAHPYRITGQTEDVLMLEYKIIRHAQSNRDKKIRKNKKGANNDRR